MRGAVLHYDQDQDYGYINGIDGKRYIFTHNDLNQGVTLARGALVEFRPDDGTAHDIVAVTPTAPSPSTGQPRQPRRSAESRPAYSTGLWAYFWRAIIADYSNFKGRARRKEFWAFWLFYTLGIFALLGFGILVDLAFNGFKTNADRTPMRAIGLIPFLVFFSGLILPSIALVVRRVHDAGLSGWFALLGFITPIGSIALLVFGLLPSQVGENPWGPVPAGVRI
ncbi:MAG: DUF805 domain-containing protein [Mesorhizobium sp.]|uniref:DUF805 domain-containing protein n=1 Tax=Mesorhizobium sp. M7A.F.Ca.ET.027.02.1.1 TaxID=2496655 RepID=UPI000FD408BB|nr:DUF805 domain-containing protein [Mesorhizobium sp. M7A.F.Ca.ET.027.02.1.1]RVD13148.1 DUF805 domain-containing protein [Mesorhizobium sp. M7A.F.Ca.ET.027.02.1.1]RWC98519.1 MAG: DUF805 domain-containing protein [Mesorhizobium sp.]